MRFNEVVGHYRNQRQAFSNPSTWPQIDIRIIEPNHGTLEVKSWYKYKGEDKPYNNIPDDKAPKIKYLTPDSADSIEFLLMEATT